MLTSSVSVRTYFSRKNTTHIDMMLLLALDPNVKLAYAEDKWDTEATQDGRERLEAVVNMLSNNGYNRTANLCHCTV